MGDDIRELRESIQRDMKQYRSNVLDAKFEEIFDRLDELEAAQQEQSAMVENIIGPEDGEEASTHETRVKATRQMLINEARTDEHGTTGWSYKDVQKSLQRNSHGKVYPQQAYRIMEDVGEAQGFAHTTDEAGNQVVRVSIAALPAEVSINDVNNGEEVRAAADGGIVTENESAD